MKPQWIESLPQPVVQRERRREKRVIRMMCGKDAECPRIGEEVRHLRKAPDGGVPSDGVEVIKVKAVVEVIGVCRSHSEQRAGRQELVSRERSFPLCED